MRATWACGLSAALVLGRVAVAAACGASAPPYYIVDEAAPHGPDAPLNTPIVVTVKEGEDGPVVTELAPSLVLMMLGDEQALPLKPLLGAPTLAWVPLAPLAPNTTYEAHYNPGYEGIPDSVWQFTTGDSQTPPLALSGKLSVTLEEGIDTFYTAPSRCGSVPTDTEERRVTKARVKLPTISGGFPRRFGELHLTDERAYEFAEPSKTAADPNEGHLVSTSAYVSLDEEQQMLITLPEEEQPYRPCFAFRATDGRGDQVVAAPFCLDQPFPLPAEPEPEPTSAAPVVADDDLHTSSACSFSVPRAPRGSLFVIAVAGLALATRVRRRVL